MFQFLKTFKLLIIHKALHQFFIRDAVVVHCSLFVRSTLSRRTHTSSSLPPPKTTLKCPLSLLMHSCMNIYHKNLRKLTWLASCYTAASSFYFFEVDFQMTSCYNSVAVHIAIYFLMILCFPIFLCILVFCVNASKHLARLSWSCSSLKFPRMAILLLRGWSSGIHEKKKDLGR